MNCLTLDIGPCEDNSTGDGVFFLVEAAVDDAARPEWLDVDEFFQYPTL